MVFTVKGFGDEVIKVEARGYSRLRGGHHLAYRSATIARDGASREQVLAALIREIMGEFVDESLSAFNPESGGM